MRVNKRQKERLKDRMIGRQLDIDREEMRERERNIDR